MQLSIIIPVKNGQATLAACLRGIQGLALAHEIIVVNDHSTDAGIKMLPAEAATIIDLQGATGPGAARNAGAKVAQGEVLLFIDADVTTSAADIEKSYGEFRQGNYRCAVARYHHNPALALPGRYYNCYMMYKYFDKTSTRIFFSSYAMISKECFLPFPEHLLTLEDAALGHQLSLAGQVIHIFSSMAVTHQKQVGVLGLGRQFVQRSRDAVFLSWSARRQGSALRDDSVKANVRLSLVLAPLMLAGLPFPRLFLGLLVALVLVNFAYFRYIKRFEGVFGLLASGVLYFYTIVCGDIGMVCGFVKVIRHELTATEIPQTPLP